MIDRQARSDLYLRMGGLLWGAAGPWGPGATVHPTYKYKTLQLGTPKWVLGASKIFGAP